MEDEKALARVARSAQALAPADTVNFKEIQALGDVLYKSGYFSDIKSAAQAVVKILRGRELGLGPVSSLEQVHVVQGKTALSAGLIGALIKRSGRYDYKIAHLNDTRCEIIFYDRGQEIGRSSFTIDDARKAGLADRDMWKKYPRNMNLARALSNGAKWYCPDVFGGAVYTPEELSYESTYESAIDIGVEPFTDAEPVAEPQVNGNGGRSHNTAEKPVRMATEPQVKKLHVLAREKGIGEAGLDAYLQANFGNPSAKALTLEQASRAIDTLSKMTTQEAIKAVGTIQANELFGHEVPAGDEVPF